ncbi:hypothetical protein V8D89_005286 [Ganoderma adspersum]
MAATFLAGAHSDILYHILLHLAADLRRSLPSQKGLEHLLCALGIAQKPHKKHRWHYPQMELRGALTAHESSWTRFQEYAFLVREIVIDPFVGTLDLQRKLLQDTFWFKLIASLGDVPILPRLEVATLHSPNCFQHCSFDMGALRLLNTSIRELNVVFPIASAEHQSKLRRALTACVSSIQDLKVLSLEVPIPIMDVDSLPRLHSRLCQLKLDRQLDIHPNQLSLLASLPNLKRLSITLNPRAPLNRPVAFGDLRELEVFSADLSAIGALIAHMAAPHLQAFSLSETSTHQEGSGRRLAKDLSVHLHTLATKWPALTAFQWSCNLPHAETGFVVASSGGRASEPLAELVVPLLSLRALRSFTASFLLRAFRLCDDTPRARHHADFAALVAFARYCPRLRSLHLPVLKLKVDPATSAADAASIAALRQVEQLAGARAHWLRELAVRHVIYPRRREEEGEEEGDEAELLQECVRELFPEATLRYPARAE